MAALPRSRTQPLIVALLAAALFIGPVAARASTLDERVATREALRTSPAHAAGHAGPPPLPLPEPPRAGLARAGDGIAGLVRARRPLRVLIGLRRHEDLPGLVAALSGVVTQAAPLHGIGVLAVTAASPSRLAARLRGDPRVAYIERNRRAARITADPGDDVDPETGIPFSWPFNDVRAPAALASAGGGSTRTVAVVDTGVDRGHPDLAGRIGPVFDTISNGRDVTDVVGHGTFVSGLIAMVDGNGLGSKGVAGNTKIVAIRVSTEEGVTTENLVQAIEFAISRRADILNLSLAGDAISPSTARALDRAFNANMLAVAASGNDGDRSNPIQFPAAALGGKRGRRGMGLSVAATRPDGSVAAFSNHNDFVSLAAPGADQSGCEHGVFSSLPDNSALLWDDPQACSQVFNAPGDPNGRYAYGEGTSFAAPIAAGIATLVWQVERRLDSEQVGHVLIRSARQTYAGSRWNEFTGRGIVNGAAAVKLARRYDISAPRVRAKATRLGPSLVGVRFRRSRDRTKRGRERAKKVRYSLMLSKDGGKTFRTLVRPKRRQFKKTVRLSGRRRHLLVATVCDGNGNCASKKLGRFRRKRPPTGSPAGSPATR